MPKLWIRNDYIHHIFVKISEDKVLFNKNTMKDGVGVDISANVAVAPVTAGVGVMVEKIKKVQQEDIVHKSIQESGWTRIDKGAEQTFHYDETSLHYMSISKHLGNGEFERIADNKELGKENANYRMILNGSLTDASWFHKYLGIGKSPSKKKKDILEREDTTRTMVLTSFKLALEKLRKRLTERDGDDFTLTILLPQAKEKFLLAAKDLDSFHKSDRVLTKHTNWIELEGALEEVIAYLQNEDYQNTIIKVQQLATAFIEYEEMVKKYMVTSLDARIEKHTQQFSISVQPILSKDL